MTSQIEPNPKPKGSRWLLTVTVVFLIVGALSFLFGLWFRQRAWGAPPVEGIQQAYIEIAGWAFTVAGIAPFLAVCCVAFWRDLVNRNKQSED